MKFLGQSKRVVIFSSLLVLPLSVFGQASTPVATEMEIKMDPYVVSTERELPPPETWTYALVPALESTIGSKVIVAPGYEILSNLSEKNTKLFINELQLRQLAGTILWPMIVKTMPRQPLVVILDRTKQAASQPLLPMALSWQGEPIAAPSPNTRVYSSRTYDNSTGVSPDFFEQAFDFAGNLDPTDPTAGSTDSQATSTARAAGAGSGTNAASPFMGVSGDDPLKSGFTVIYASQGMIAAQINADVPIAGVSEAPTEEALAADLSRRAVEYTMASYSQKAPQWFYIGMGWLIGSTQVSPQRITFAAKLSKLGQTAMPSLLALLAKTTALDTDEDEALAACFAHYGLYGDNGKHAEKFMALVQMQSERLSLINEFTETCGLTPAKKTTAFLIPALLQSEEAILAVKFKEIFGLPVKKMEVELATYSRTFAAYKFHELRGDLPPMPDPIVRTAKQSEVARLEANSLIAQGKPDLALNVLRIAYWRGEREPVMLSLLAWLEEAHGSPERAQKIVDALAAQPTQPPRIFVTVAKLRFRAIIAQKQASEKLTGAETRQIMEPLGRAIQAGQISEEVCAFMSEVVLRSGGRPHESIGAFLDQALKKYPKNAKIREAADFAHGKTSPTQQ